MNPSTAIPIISTIGARSFTRKQQAALGIKRKKVREVSIIPEMIASNPGMPMHVNRPPKGWRKERARRKFLKSKRHG